MHAPMAISARPSSVTALCTQPRTTGRLARADRFLGNTRGLAPNAIRPAPARPGVVAVRALDPQHSLAAVNDWVLGFVTLGALGGVFAAGEALLDRAPGQVVQERALGGARAMTLASIIIGMPIAALKAAGMPSSDAAVPGVSLGVMLYAGLIWLKQKN